MAAVAHTVEVTAATLYEAVGQGLAAMRGNEWVAGIAEGLNAVKVSVADVRVEHQVKMVDFRKWLEKPAVRRARSVSANGFVPSWVFRSCVRPVGRQPRFLGFLKCAARGSGDGDLANVGFPPPSNRKFTPSTIC
jgi:hypothetical protein